MFSELNNPHIFRYQFLFIYEKCPFLLMIFKKLYETQGNREGQRKTLQKKIK